MSVMNAHETPSGTRMMWNARVNAICARAHGTGFTAIITPRREAMRVASDPDPSGVVQQNMFADRELTRDGPWRRSRSWPTLLWRALGERSRPQIERRRAMAKDIQPVRVDDRGVGLLANPL